MGKIVYRVETPAEYKRNAKDRVAKAEGMIRHVYVDVGGVPTTANGKALVVHGSANKWVIDPAGERILKDATGRGYTDEQRATLQMMDELFKTNPEDYRHILYPAGEGPRKPIEDVMNHPQNLNLFDVLADQLMALLGLGGTSNPGQAVVDSLVQTFRDGTVKLPGDILLPDIREKKDGPVITILGVPVGVGYPGVIIEENPQPRPGLDHLPFYRNGEGKVVVKAHNRGGHPVKEYSRSAPDGDVTNNLSYKPKG